MILQALSEYYERCLEDPEEKIPKFGYAPQQVGWVLHIGRDGSLLHDPEDVREVDEKGKKRNRIMELPSLMQKRAVGIAPQFLWDNTGYVLGCDAKGKPERAQKQFEAFRALHNELLAESDDEGLLALLRFLNGWSPERAEGLAYWGELAGQNVVFRFENEPGFLHERAEAKRIWAKRLQADADGPEGVCLVTGEHQAILKLHPAVKNVRNAQSSGASLVSFNAPAFESYGKEQNINAPLSAKAAFAYTTPLNHLLGYESKRKTRIGDTDVVFWAEERSPLEAVIQWTTDPFGQDEPTEDLRLALDAIRSGKRPRDLDSDASFYVLGLAGNSARVVVRFWLIDTIGELADRLGRHFDDLRIVRSYENQPDFPSVNQLLRDIAPLGKHDRIPAPLGGSVMRSILSESPYPRSILSMVVERIRADGRVSYLRAAITKAVIARQVRLSGRGEEVSVKLDTESTNVPYRLGRLFAILERIQEDANPGIKATIKDRYYGSASATPASVFGQLLRLSSSHIKKADKRPYHEGLIQTVLGEIEELPRHLNLEDQGRFALGYYHQRQWFFTKKEDREAE